MKLRINMAKWLFVFGFFTCFSVSSNAQTWNEWFKQKETQRKYLLLQIARLQVYLGYLKKGYDIVHKGLDLIGDIKKGDLDLHTVFFDHLKLVNPNVKKYAKVAEIIQMQTGMTGAYKSYYKDLKGAKELTAGEIDYLYHVFTNLLDQLSGDIVVLTDVLTDGRLEMSDQERIARIDLIYGSVSEKYVSLFSFMNKVQALRQQREKELQDIETLKKLYRP